MKEYEVVTYVLLGSIITVVLIFLLRRFYGWFFKIDRQIELQEQILKTLNEIKNQ